MLSRQFVQYVAIGVLVALGLSSASAMWGDLNGYQAKRLELRWGRLDAPLTLAQWHSARSYLETALAFSPGHPDYLQSMGRLYSWRFFVADAEPAVSDTGLAFYQQAIAERPYWPYAWSELALLKSQAGQFDEAFWQAMTVSQQYGPWDRRSVMSALNAGLGAWPQLSWSQRGDVQALFEKALSFSVKFSRQAFAMAEQRGMEAAFCVSLQSNDISQFARRHCQQVLSKSVLFKKAPQ
ncbi:hypothetical protein G8770_23475 [Aestuariicella hydrocarbonica]|uniref:Uncharacterized protein n=1 Tax=Pseudomaricurvus hydrocarbonicus TaxID=1470433 RepID=A0A9E5T538_9GAMM|nr:hypothetical protein [Aestuariicella hydrocarbonica]NHO68524.1 hypothetical protein [Aestuariicella hydrocarbonica]